MEHQTEKKESAKPSFLEVVGSVLSALLGVQSEKVRQRDFQHGSPVSFIVVGVLLVTLFVLILWVIVKIVLSQLT
ncbi:MAG: DUF2970 domain-containing protein [Gammaproteobacteria bacterium]